jgi:hypothetical protein
MAPKPHARELLEMYRSLQLAEKEVLQAVRDSEWEGREIGRTRANQEQTIALEAPYHDICRIQVSRHTSCSRNSTTKSNHQQPRRGSITKTSKVAHLQHIHRRTYSAHLHMPGMMFFLFMLFSGMMCYTHSVM